MKRDQLVCSYEAYKSGFCLALTDARTVPIFSSVTAMARLYKYSQFNQYPYPKIGFVQMELFHDQLPLAVPCYDLVPVTKFTFGHINADFGYPRLP